MYRYRVMEKKVGKKRLLLKTICIIAAAVVFVSTIATVCIVMIRMLSQTPGDLIYDRN